MENVTMTAEERREFEAYRAEKAKKEAAARRKQQRADYAGMVDDELCTTLPILKELSEQIKVVKGTVFGNFEAILKMKSDVLGLTKEMQHSHTFTSSDSRFRLTLGVNTIDSYRDTVEDGIAMVKAYIQSLAKDDTSKALVNAVLRLLSRDQSGNIKASRVLQLRKMAQETGDLLVERGSIVIGNTDSQIAESVLVAMRGEWKECPLIGGEVKKILGGQVDVMWRGEVKKMLEACGLDVQKVSISEDNIITVE